MTMQEATATRPPNTCPPWCVYKDAHDDIDEVVHFGKEACVPTSYDPWGTPSPGVANIYLQRDEQRPATVFVGKGEGDLGLGCLRLDEAEQIAHVLLEMVKQARGHWRD